MLLICMMRIIVLSYIRVKLSRRHWSMWKWKKSLADNGSPSSVSLQDCSCKPGWCKTISRVRYKKTVHQSWSLLEKCLCLENSPIPFEAGLLSLELTLVFILTWEIRSGKELHWRSEWQNDISNISSRSPISFPL